MEIREYVTRDGKVPFNEWLKKLRDQRALEKILTRIDRLETGNTGQCKSLGEGLHELRIHYGPGYRVYFGNVGNCIILLLCGGDKASQQQDIKRARRYWNDCRRR